MQWNRLVSSTAILAVSLVAFGQPVSYDRRTTPIRAGTLLIDNHRLGGLGGPVYHGSPNLFWILDNDASTKPAGWSFINPLGRTTLSASDAARWSLIDGTTPVAGTQMAKNNAPYWEVPLGSVSDESLSQFDILVMSPRQGYAVSGRERELLRNYIDQGGTLWIDNFDGSQPDPVSSYPYGFELNPSIGPFGADFNHPLLSTPNRLNNTDLAAMTSSTLLASTPLAPIALQDLLYAGHVANSARFLPVAGFNNGSTISVARLGQGTIVVTTGSITATLNRGRNPATGAVDFNNWRFNSFGAVQDAGYRGAIKFALNVVALNSDFNGSRGGSRNTGASAVNISAPLLRQFSEDFPAGAFTPSNPPSIAGGYMVTTNGDGIQAFDARTGYDINRDGNSDDGVEDPLNAQGDLVWEVTGLGRTSPVTIIENGATALTNSLGNLAPWQAWVTLPNGNVRVYDLTNGDFLAETSPPTPSLADPDGPYAPTVHENLVLVADTRSSDQTGRVWVMDLNTGAPINFGNLWQITGAPRLKQPSASPTVGYIPIQDSSGGLDRVVYVSTKPNNFGVPTPAGLTSIWLGARSEPPVQRRVLGAFISLSTRASLQGLPVVIRSSALPASEVGLKVTMLFPDGSTFSDAGMAQYLNGTVTQGTNGELRLGLTGLNPFALDLDGTSTPGNPADDIGWRIDYTVDWGQAGAFGGVPADSFVRGNLEFPDDASNSRRVLGAPVLSATGNVMVNTSAAAGTTGGTFFNLKEVGRGDFRLVYRWDMYDFHSYTVNGGTTVNFPATFMDYEGLLEIIPFLIRPMRQMNLVGNPVIKGDTVFITARGTKTIFGPGSDAACTILVALEADPGPLEFTITSALPNNAQLTLRQQDISRSTNKAIPEVSSVIAGGQFTSQRQSDGTTRITMDSAMNVRAGRILDSISSSLPVTLVVNGSQETVIEPEALSDDSAAGYVTGLAAGRFSPLRWYSVMNGLRADTGPVLAGQTVYVGGASVLPGLLTAGFSFPLVENGLLFAFDGTVASNDRFLRSAESSTFPPAYARKPWMTQLSALNPTGALEQAESIRWPQTQGIQSFDDLRVRLLQAALPYDRVLGLAAGNGTLGVTSSQGLFAYRRADFTVVDRGRVGRFDGVGNPLWATLSTLNTGSQQPIGNAGREVPLSDPWRAYPLGDGTTLVADSGNNRVVRMDASGREVRTIRRMLVDQNYIPDGYVATQTVDLRTPRDVVTFEQSVDAANNPFSNPQPRERWVHYLIADTGNNRAVELVDRYVQDPISGRIGDVVQYNSPEGVQRALGVLYWHTPEELSGKRFAYNSIGRVTRGTGVNRRVVVALGFGLVEPGRAGFGLDATFQANDTNSGNGGIVVYDGTNTLVINQFEVPPIQANTLLGPTGAPNTWNFNTPPVDRASVQKKMAGLSSVTLRYVTFGGNDQLAVMITDATGVYELIQPSPVAAPDNWRANWMLPNEAYIGMRRPRDGAERPTPIADITTGQLGNNPQQFRPFYARRLQSGDVLIVNGYVGSTRTGGLYNGEVVVIDGNVPIAPNMPGYSTARYNLGFSSLSVKFELPPVQGIRGISNPVFAETD